LLVCVGPRCDAEGRGRALATALCEKLAAADNADAVRKIGVSTRDCLRSCTREPIVRIEPSGEVFSNHTVEDLLRIACCGEAIAD
jgi:NADH:ubiquinone oxidoreductase subunit E